jgi:pentapeptide MXKDX repeat protein
MKKIAMAVAAAAFLISGTSAFAQASGAMSNDAMSSGAMSHDAMSKDKMSHDKMSKSGGKMKHDKMSKGDAMGHEASGAMSQ